MTLQAGQAILDGKYKILKLIGEGGMARVWLAEEPRFGGRQVALKEPKASLLPDMEKELQARYQREVDVCAALDHADVRNIVRALTAEPYDGSLLLAMEYMPGGDLAAVLAQHPGGLPVERAVAIVFDLLRALDGVHAHKLEIVHRDIKPSNVLFDEQGVVHLGDFGLAQLAGVSDRSQLQGGQHPGTPMYMAPEQESSTRALTRAADLYALGCVLFEMLTGKRYKRFKPGTRASTLRSEVPGWLEKVLAKTLTEDPDARYQDAAAFAQDLKVGLYEQGKQSVEEHDWTTAIEALRTLLSKTSGHRDAKKLLGQAQTGQKRADKLRQAADARKRQDWPKAISALESLLKEAPGYQEAQALLAEVQVESRREAVYKQASEAIANHRWEKATDALREFLSDVPDDRGARALLKEASSGQRRQKRRYQREALAHRVRVALKGLSQAWATAVGSLDRLRSISFNLSLRKITLALAVAAVMMAAAALIAALVLWGPQIALWLSPPASTPVTLLSTPDPALPTPFSAGAVTTQTEAMDISTTKTAPAITPCLFPSGWLSYTVRPGDNLSSIADTSGTSMETLMSGNCLTTTEIYVDQTILVPCIPRYDWERYTVRQGETLFRLAFVRGLTTDQLQWANCLPTDQIQAGQSLWLPPSAASQPQATPTATKRPVSKTPTATRRPASKTPTPPTSISSPTLTLFKVEYDPSLHDGCAVIAQWTPPQAQLTNVRLEIYRLGSVELFKWIPFASWGQWYYRAQVALPPGDYFVKLTWIDPKNGYVDSVPAQPSTRSNWHLIVEQNGCRGTEP